MPANTNLSRRTVLSVAAAGGLAPAVVPSLPAAAAVRRTSPQTPPGGLRLIAPGAGVKQVFRDVFKSSSFLDMLLFQTSAGAVKVATATTGNTKQFQVFDAATGKRELASTVPEGRKITSNLIWDPTVRSVYAAAGGGTLTAWSPGTKQLVSLGQVAPDATAAYGFDIDSSGRLWGGSYPNGIIWNYDPKTKAFTSLPPLDGKTDYVKAIGIWKDTVFVGTGAQDPHLVFFPVDKPKDRTVIALPDGGDTGFVHRIIVRGNRIFVFAEDSANVTRCYVYNPVAGDWEENHTIKSAGKGFSEQEGGNIWHVVGGAVTRTTTETMEQEALCPTNMSITRAVLAAGDKVFVAGNHDGGPVVAQYSIKGRKETKRVRPGVLPGSLGVQSLIGSDHGLLYFGAYQGDGLASLNPDTGDRWQSAGTVGISQIEHLMQYDTNRLYIGSYGSAKLYSFDRKRIHEEDGAFTHITTLRKPYMQSRPFAWGAAGGVVLAGTVPEYGFRGGALATIDPVKNELGPVLNKFVPEQSIVGLSGYGDTAYGTTSGRGGYGISDYRGDACVFAYNPRTDRTLWMSYLRGHRHLYSPILMDDVLYVATINGLLALDPSTGALKETLEVRKRSGRPGYQSARALRIPGASKIVHSSGSVVLLIDVKERTQSVLAENGFGTPLAVMPDGRVFVSHQSNHIAELHTGPNASITSRADLVTINPAGELMVAASNGAGRFGDPVAVDSGWDVNTMLSFHVTDWNGDGIPDLLVQRSGGSLYLHRGKAGGGFEPGVKVGSGWAQKGITVGPWTDGVHPSVIGVDKAGRVLHHRVSSNGKLGAGQTLGTGWQDRRVTMIDMAGTGRQGLLGRSGGKFIFQPSDGAGRFAGAKQEVAGAGWGDATSIASVKAHQWGLSGVLSVKRSGALEYASAFGTRFAGTIHYPMDLRSSLLAGSRRT